jgi:signal transduction protein with GAF and PtsI domain
VVRTDHESAFLQRLAHVAASTADADELTRLVISETTEVLGVDVCSLYLLDADRRLRLTATNGLSQERVGQATLAVGEGVAGGAALTRHPIAVEDVTDDPYFRWVPGVDQWRLTSMCAVPITDGGRLVGALAVQTERRHAFSAAEIDLLESIAEEVARSLGRAAG